MGRRERASRRLEREEFWDSWRTGEVRETWGKDVGTEAFGGFCRVLGGVVLPLLLSQKSVSQELHHSSDTC